MRFGARLRRWYLGRRYRLWTAALRLEAARFDYPPLLERPPGSRVLILAPHPDDDAIGAGGTLVKHGRAGACLTTAVLTDGSAGVPGRPRAEVAALRRGEQEAAARHLGVERLVFWDEPDGGLVPRESTAARLQALLREVEPDCIYLPCFLDAHPDHRAVTPLLARALGPRPRDLTCVAYESWTPLLPNALVDVTAQMEVKLRAIAEHRSQLARVAYDELVRGLNRWRSGAYSRTVAFAEAFFIDEVAAYLALWRRVTGGGG